MPEDLLNRPKKKKTNPERSTQKRRQGRESSDPSGMGALLGYLAGVSSSSLLTSTQNRHGRWRPARSPAPVPTLYTLEDEFTLGWFHEV